MLTNMASDFSVVLNISFDEEKAIRIEAGGRLA